MKQTLVACAALFVMLFHGAQAAPASQASAEELLEVTRAETMMDTMYANIEQAMRQGMVQGLGGRALTPDQQRVFDALPGQFARLIREEMSWSKLKPGFVQIYRDTFEQDEVDGLLAFYKSPSGKVFIDRMPAVMQKSMALTQAQMKDFYPKMQAAMDKAIADMKAAK